MLSYGSTSFLTNDVKRYTAHTSSSQLIIFSFLFFAPFASVYKNRKFPAVLGTRGYGISILLFKSNSGWNLCEQHSKPEPRIKWEILIVASMHRPTLLRIYRCCCCWHIWTDFNPSFPSFCMFFFRTIPLPLIIFNFFSLRLSLAFRQFFINPCSCNETLYVQQQQRKVRTKKKM